MKPLRIGINALYLIPGGVGGTEIYLRHLLAALARIDAKNRYFVFTNRETGRDISPGAANFEICPQGVSAVVRPARLLWEQGVLPAAAWRLGLDVMLNAGFTAPVVCPCPSVTVFHDLQHKRHPEYFRWFDLPFWRLFLWLSARRSRLLLADSEATEEDLRRYYPFTAGKTEVVKLGVDPEFFRLGEGRRQRREQPYVLAVATLHPHKNLELLVEVFAEFRRMFPDWRLVIAGMRGFHAAAVEQRVKTLGLEKVVELTGWVAREKLYEYYREASVFVYPTKFEGFGLPLLEALAAGVPVICSAIEPLASLAAGAAVLCPPDEMRAWVEALRRVVEDEVWQAELARRGRERARAFSWEETARRTLEALEKAAEG